MLKIGRIHIAGGRLLFVLSLILAATGLITDQPTPVYGGLVAAMLGMHFVGYVGHGHEGHCHNDGRGHQEGGDEGKTDDGHCCR